MRPLGIAALEDKIVQQAVVSVLNQIYEVDFLGFSYGFRPGRGPHDALDALWVGIMGKKVNWVLDADIRGFFDTIDHGWLVKFLEHRIADRRILRLIQKWLRAGVSEDGQWSKTEVGTPQGAVASPLLANVFLHYVFDLWVQQWRTKSATGDMIVVRYADDFVVGFQHRREAERFLRELGGRLEKFGLALHPEKTRLIEFGRFAAENRRKRGEGKPETFTFLGFTHICGRKRWSGGFIVKRKTATKRLRAKLQRGEGGAAAAASRADPEARRVAAKRGAGVLQLPRSPRQHGSTGSVPHGRRSRSWLQRLAASKPAAPDDVGAVRAARRSLDSQGPDPAPVPERPLLRQAPEVRAVCGNSARTDLRGGTPARAVPTATAGSPLR